MTRTNTTNTIDNDNDDDATATAIAHATTVSSNLKHALTALLMKQQTDALSSVLTRLNGEPDDKGWEMIKREPSTLLTLLISEYSKRLQEELIVLGQKEEKEIGD